jgi:hypothetical protein
MAKHKGQQALFDLLRKDCPEGQASAKPTPVIRRTVAAATPAPISAPKPVEAPRPEPALALAPRRLAEPPAPLLLREMSVPVSWLLIGVIGVGCLVVIAFVVGQRYGSERLPDVPKHPTFAEIQGEGVKPNLVAKSPTQPLPVGPPAGLRPAAPPSSRPGASSVPPRPATAEKSVAPAAPRPGTAEKPAVTETPSGPQFRVRIAQLAVSQPDSIDKMRGFLLQKDIETDLETSRGFYVLYSRERLSDKKKADELAARINKHLDAFEKATKIPTSKTAYVTQMTKE